jgi:4-hydroxy-tetrahydrodipicolinate reductase
MTIAIVGYGKMGRMIEALAVQRGIKIGPKLDVHDRVDAESLRGADVAIEFSTPNSVVDNIENIAAAGVDLVVGTTGWTNRIEHVKALVERHNIGLVWSPNYSVGVNAFFRIVKEAAKLLASEPEYEAWAWEIHHSAKKDAPSGTLLKLVDEMKSAGYARHVDTAANRAGVIAGTHEIGFDSMADTITLRHSARSREGFAFGALKAAEWIAGKKGFHEFADILFQS